MPNSIDNKIVEMQFDNANFEKNVRQSIKTLDALNKALELEDAAKGFEQMEKAANSIDLSKLTTAAEVIEKRFSAAGIAGAALINRTVNGTINLIGKLGSQVVNLAKTGGIRRALNLEHANFMLNGILKDAGKVADIMNGPVNDAVSGTAYGLDSAAKAAGQFVASGVRDLEKLRIALTGISGVAAMSGSSYDEIARIFNKVAARGKVMGDTIQELSTRGIAAQEELAKYLKVTVAEVQDLQKKGEISFEAFSNAMYDAFAEQAKKANETFTGAMSNVKAALSRIGAKIASPAIEGLRKIFVSLIETVNELNKLLSNSLIKRIVEFIEMFSSSAAIIVKSRRAIQLIGTVVENLEKIFDNLVTVMGVVHKAFKNVFPNSALVSMTNFQKSLGKLIDLLTISDQKAAYLQFTLQGLFAAFDIILTVVKQLVDILLPGLSGVYDATDSVGEKVLKLTGFIGYMLTQFDKWIKNNNILKIGLGLLTTAVSKLTDQTTGFYKVISVIGTVIGGVIYVFSNIVTGIGLFVSEAMKLPIVQKVVDALKISILNLGQLAAPILLEIADGFIALVDASEKFAQGGYITTGLEKLNGVLNNIYWGAQNAFGAVGAFFGLFKKGDPVEKIETVTVKSEKLYASMESLNDGSNQLVNSMTGVTHTLTRTEDAINNVATTSTKQLDTLSQAGKIFAIGFGASIISAGVNIGRAFREIGKTVKSIGGVTKSLKLFFEQLNLNLRIKTLLAFAGTIVIFAGALALLTQLDTKKLLIATGIVAALVTYLTIICKSLSGVNVTNLTNLSTATGSILAFASAILVLSVAAKVLTSVGNDWDALKNSLKGLLGIMAMMTVSLIALGHFQKNAISGTWSMIAFASALFIMTKSLAKLAQLDLEKVNEAIPILLKIIGGLAMISLVSGLTISPVGGFAVIGIVAALCLLMDELTILGGFDRRVLLQVEDLMTHITECVASLLGFALVIKTLEVIKALLNFGLQRIKGITGQIKSIFVFLEKGLKYVGIAAMITSMAIAIKLVSDSLIALSALSIPEILKGAVTVAAIEIAVIGVTEAIVRMATHVLGTQTSALTLAAGFAGIGVALLSMAISVRLLAGNSDMFIDGISKVSVTLVVLLGFIYFLGEIAKTSGNIQIGIKTFTGLSILLGTMVASLAVLGLLTSLDPTGMWMAVSQLVAIMIMLALVISQVAKMSEMTPAATVAIFGMIGVFTALGICFAIIDKNADTLNVLGLMGIMLGTVYLMGQIMTGLASVNLAGVVAVGAITGVIIALSGCAMMLESIDPAKFLQQVMTMQIAVGGLALIMFALGAVFAGPGAAVISAGIVILGLLAGIMVVVSAASIGFGIAANLIGVGLGLISDSLHKMTDLDLTSMSLQIGALAVSLFSLGSTTLILGAFATALYWAIPAFGLFGMACDTFGNGLIKIQSINLEGLMANMIRLGQAAQFVAERFLTFAAFSVIANGLGYSLGVLSAGITALSLSLAVLTGAFSLALTGLESFVKIIDIVVGAFGKLTEYIHNARRDFEALAQTSIYEIYSNLVKVGADLMPQAGEVLSDYLFEGFKNACGEAAADVIKDTVNTMLTFSESLYDQAYNAGWKLGDAFDKGVRDPTKSYCENEPGKALPDDTVEGSTNEGERQVGNMEAAGGILGEAYPVGIWDKMKSGLSQIKANIAKFINDIKTGNFSSIGETLFGGLTGGYSDAVDKAMKDIGKKKGGIESGRYTSVAGVGYIHSSGKVYKNLIQDSRNYSNAIDVETEALGGASGGSGGGGGNTKAVKKNTAAKEENAEANEKKTASINEESEALNEETEAAAENEEEIRALAEEIEVVTKAYDTSLDTIGRADKFKMVKKQAQIMSDFWSKGLKGEGAWKTVQEVYRAYKAIDNSALTTAKVFKKGVYAYKESGKYLKKYKNTLLTSAKEIEKKVLKTGNTIAKVTNGQAKMFYKNGNTVEKMTIRLTKRAKNLGKQFAEARAFATALSQENISEKVLNTEKIEDFVYPLRKIQDLFVSRGSMPKAVQDYLGTIRYKLLELNDSMNMLAKNIDGVGSTWKSNAQNTAYVQDAFLSLAASLYDGSEAANEYATEQARLEFLMEHGLATEEEVAEHRESYISRITKALVEYKNTLQDTLQGSLDVWKMFDTKDEDSKTDFIKTIESQLAGYRQWGDMLMELSKRGLSFDIQKELTEAGVESFGKLKSLLSMTREELALFMVDYQQSQTAAERAANLAVAALANARTQATARAAAKSGKITQKQINESRKAAREIANNNKALARDQAIYHSMTKKQEKDYLKTLTKRQRAEYKNAKKEEKKLQKEREALAAQERARRAEIERIETVAASITSYDSLIDVLHRYANDAGVINKVNEILKDTMNKVNKTFKDTGLSTEQFIFIAHKLGAEGDTLDNFLSSVSSTLDSVAESAVGANKELKSMFETLKQSTTENRLSTMFKNFASHTAATSQYATLLKILQQNGLSTEGVDYIIKQWSSDQAGTLDLMRQLVSGGAKEITEFNRYFVRQQQINDKAKAESIKALYESTKNYEQELYNAALARKQNADAKVSQLMTSESARTQEELAAIRHANSELERILIDFTFDKLKSKRKFGKNVSASSYVEAIMGTRAENTKKIAALNKLGVEAYGNSFNTYLNYAKKIEQYQERVNKYRSKGISNLTSQERDEYMMLRNSINNAYEAQERMNFSSAAKKQVEYILTLEKRTKYEEEARKAALEMARAEQANATAAYNEAKARWDKYNAELAAAEQEAALAESYEENYISVTALARGYEQWTEALRKNASTAGVLKKAYERVKDTLGNVKSSVDIARSLFKDWEGISRSPIRELTLIEEGFLRLANAMSEGEKSAEEFTEAATQALTDYRNTLYDNIKGSISIFEEFTKATNKQAKSASTYLDNIQSNMNAIKEWNDAMVTLSKRGVSTEWLKMFAAEGVNSYEKVMAFVQATDKQIGELNQDMVDYQKYLETTTDTTLAAIASSMTDSAISVQEAMIRVFTSEGADRFKQAGYDSSMMIITGLKNGLTNAMPEIVESISESTSSVSVANTLGREVGQAINQGLVTAVSNSVSETVNAAVEKFKMAVDSVNSYAQEYLQQDYTVRIHVDASEMDAAVARMNAAIYGINANAVSTSDVVSTSMANQNASNANSGAVATSAVTNNITYNQTNNSPKALSRTEIYRQTRNQLSTIESVVSSATG